MIDIIVSASPRKDIPKINININKFIPNYCINLGVNVNTANTKL